jgi:hypothetical protein
MGDKQIKVQDIIELLEEPIDLIKTMTTDPTEIESIINVALYEYLYPPKKSIRDRIMTTVDDRPCDTEAPDNVVRVNFK